MDPSHEHLLEGVTRGDPHSLDTLVRRHLPGLLAFVRARAGRRLRARDATMDLVQSACREVLQDLGSRGAEDEASFRHWLYQAAERKIVDRARYHAREKRDVGREAALPESSGLAVEALRQGYSGFWSPSREAAVNEELLLLEDALQRLSDEHREVIVLTRIVGLSHADVAGRLGKTEGATRVLLHRALARLAREMKPTADGPG